MPTRRLLSEIFAFFAPNQPPRSITPDRVQDLVETVRPTWGRMSMTGAPQVTTIATQNVWTKATCATELGGDAYGFTSPENNRLTANGGPLMRVSIDGSLNVQSQNNQNLELAIALNGTIDPKSIRRVRIGTGGDVEGAALNTDFRKEPGDYVEVWVRNTTSSADVTVLNMYLSAKGFAI